MMTHLNSNKIYYVYKILFEGKTVYIGRTNNITKRKQHHKSLYKSGKKKKLYDYLRNTNKFDGIFELITIKSYHFINFLSGLDRSINHNSCLNSSLSVLSEI